MPKKNVAPAFLANVTESQSFDEDKLTELRNAVVEAKNLELQIESAEADLSIKKQALNQLLHKDLPDLFLEIGIDEIAVPASGNFLSFRATCAPYYAAGIPVKWDVVKRQEAFTYLTDNGAGDLIKTEINVKFQRTDREIALRTAQKLQGEGFEPEMKEAVHQATLTAWLREQIELNNWVPDLEKIGGTVGRVVKIKDKK
jgi:hypothetical protein